MTISAPIVRLRVPSALIALAALAPAVHAQQWWWPPDMRVQPLCPSPISQIEVSLNGQWPDSCIPNRADVIRAGLEIDLNIRREPPPGMCLTVITPWHLSIEVGALPAGTYSIYSTYYGAAGPATPRTLLGTIQVDPTCPGGPCYPNCDGSTVEPILNVDDFTCFINEFAAAQALPHEQQVTHYVNCDQSTVAPVLNVDDFTCFINQFAAGCR
jgi:hypothetical protein